MVEDTPDDQVFELHNAALWWTHPYGYSILGTRESVVALGTYDLRMLHALAYCPSQIVVAAAGNIEHEQLLDVLELTGWLRIGGERPHVPDVPPPLTEAARYVHVPREVGQTHVVFGTPTFAHGDPRRYTLLLASSLVGGGMSSRLFQRVREELGLAYSVQTFHAFHADTGMHGVYVASAPEVASDGLTAEEIASGKSQLKGQVTIAMESVSARMYRAAGAELYGEPYQTMDEVLSRIDAIEADEVAGVCREFFDPARQTILSLGRKEIAISG